MPPRLPRALASVSRPWGMAARLGVWLLGFAIVVKQALVAQGGLDYLWRHGADARHRFTAMAMLQGTLRLRFGFEHIHNDEQIYNGAVYTNWGFGAPLLQVPFHALARHFASFPGGFFPDRTIFFVYLVATIPVLWWTAHRLLGEHAADRGWFRREALAWTVVLFVLTFALFPLMSGRFIVYEQTVSYFLVFELLALAAYVGSWTARGPWPLVAMGLAAGVAFVVRATGLVYLGVWGVILLLERRTLRSIAAFAAGALPLVVFGLYANWAKSGSVTSFGYQNSMPWYPFHYPEFRFGLHSCADTLGHTLTTARRLFRWFFVSITESPGDDDATHAANEFLARCRFKSEARPPASSTEAFFGVAYLACLLWALAHHLVRRERRIEVYVPFAACVFLHFEFATTPGFGWRYAGDFWPAFAIVGVHYVRSLPASAGRFFGARLAGLLGLLIAVSMARDIVPARSTIEVLDDDGAKKLGDEFAETRQPAPLPATLACGQVPSTPYNNGLGWKRDCSTDTFTNVFLGVPKKDGQPYELRFVTQGVHRDSLPVYVNGRIYTARREKDTFVATLRIDYGALTSPAVMATIEWTPELDPKPGKLLSVAIV